ncbi:type VII secretion system-associated protein [Actinoallomurus acaciae]|uniref:Type VII secretion system-associated protein n=1 Tax=Actinoallomurus acaciae TaxID=502577 RepID=A0ABV5Y967_9ACTN
MADKKLALDKNGLQDFVDHQIAPFQDSLDKIANTDTEAGVAIGSITGDGYESDTEKGIFKAQRPLSIGKLATDSGSGGDKLVKKVSDVCDSITDVYTKQINLFRDLHDNLDTTIKKLMDGQHDTLVKIDGKIFLDGLGTLPGDFQDTGSSGDS